jgi:hypothetical protein
MRSDPTGTNSLSLLFLHPQPKPGEDQMTKTRKAPKKPTPSQVELLEARAIARAESALWPTCLPIELPR